MGLGNAFEGAYSTLSTVTGTSPGESEPTNMQEAVSMIVVAKGSVLDRGTVEPAPSPKKG